MEMRLVVGDLQIALTPTELESVLWNLDHSAEVNALLKLLATHPSLKLRVQVAESEGVDLSTWETLLLDDDYPVARAAAESFYHREHLSADLLLRVLDKHPSILNGLCSDIESVLNCETSTEEAVETLEQRILSAPDPQLRIDVAKNACAPKGLLRKLAKDSDLMVQSTASRSLRNS